MKTWKCPHCKRTETSEDDIVMFLCPTCIDCNMEELETEPILATEKPGEIKDFDKSGKQMCLRCYKVYAIGDEMYCQKCIQVRKEIDEIQTTIGKMNEEKNKK